MNSINVYLDFTCPYCYIGHHRIEKAIQMNAIDPREVRYRAFQLNPTFPDPGIPRTIYRERKFGSMEESRRRDAIVIDIAKKENLKINFNLISLTPNTRRAHRVIKIAESQGIEVSELYNKIFSAYFTDGRDIGNTQVLIELAASLNIAVTQEQLIINTADIDTMIDQDIADGRLAGLTTVPFVIENKKTEPISITSAVNILSYNYK